MPLADPTEFKSLALEAFQLIYEFTLHDVWRVELEGKTDCTIADLRSRLSRERLPKPNAAVRALFALRSTLGRIFRLDSNSKSGSTRLLIADLPERLSSASRVPPGAPEGPFTTLYVLHDEAAYEIVNSTVHAVLVVALTATATGHRFFWATYLKPVGRITSFYMRLIDPFRRKIVYPGLESWLKRAWAESG